MLFDVKNMNIYNVTSSKEGLLKRDAFGVVSRNNTIVVVGGYEIEGNELKEISKPFIQSFKLESSRYVASNSINNSIFALLAFPFILGMILIWRKRIRLVAVNENINLKKCMQQPDLQKLEISSALTDGLKITTTQPQELSITLSNTTYQGVFIPGYKEFRIGYDFTLQDKLAEGGFGAVFIGKIIQEKLSKEYNNGQSECVIKIAKTSIGTNVFMQELSIHELFRREKYLAQLICYSEEPQTIVLKYYRYGTLNSFIFPSKTHPSPSSILEYSLKNIFHIAEKLAWGYNLMHSKKVIHNDIKPLNILLDGDDEEPLYPVITDFGICKILGSADVIKGFEICEIKAFTTHYAASEVLYSLLMKEEKRKSNTKTDVYSVGVVLYELFTRKRVWKKFDTGYVITGGLPEISLERITNQWKEIEEQVAVNLLCLVVDCMEYDCEKRPSMKEIHENLLHVLKNIS